MNRNNRLIFRQICRTDYKCLVSFFRENTRKEITKYFHPFPLNSQKAYQIARTHHLDRYYIAILEEKIVGFSMLRGWDNDFEIPSLGILVDHIYHRIG